MAVCLTHLWQQEELSDIDIVLKRPGSDIRGGQGAGKKRKRPAAAQAVAGIIRRLPGHKAILSGSPYFRAQVQRWQDESSKQAKATKPEASLTIDSDEQEAAAMAVLAALYGVSTPREDLTDVQLLHMVLLADLVQVSAVAETAVEHLVSAAQQEQLSEAAKHCMLGLHAWPSCLLDAFNRVTARMPLQDVAAMWSTAAGPSSPTSLQDVLAAPHSLHMQQLLVQELGDLEVLWEEAEKRDLFLDLPLPAVQLLLSSDDIKVSSEDTVLFAAQAYLNHKQGQQLKQRKAVQQQLAQLVRCPLLARMWLSAVTRAGPQDMLVLDPLKHEIGELLGFLQVSSWDKQRFQKYVPSTPASWMQGARRRSSAGLSLTAQCELPISELKRLCLQAQESGRTFHWGSPASSRTLLGLQFKVLVDAIPDSTGKGVTVGVYFTSPNVPSIMYSSFDSQLSAGGMSFAISGHPIQGNKGLGYSDFFNLGPMAGGWDEAAWASEGLPTAGHLSISVVIRQRKEVIII